MYKLKYHIIISLLVQIVLMFIALIINKLLSINLGVVKYGEFNIIKKASTVLSFSMLAGMGIAIPKYIPLSKFFFIKYKYLKAAFVIVFGISVIFLGFGFIFRKTINQFVFNGLDYTFISYFYALSITSLSFLYSYYRGFNKILYFNLIQILVQIVILIITFFFAKDIISYLLLNIISGLMIFVIFVIFEFRNYINKLNNLFVENKNFFTYLKELWVFGYPRMIGDFFLFSLNTIPLLIINAKFGIKESSFFSVAITLSSIVSPIFSYLGVILLPKISLAISEGNKNIAVKIVNKFLIIYIVLSIIFTILILFLKDDLINLFFSSEFLGSKESVFWVSFSILPNAIYLLLRNPIDVFSKIPFNTLNLFACSLIGFFCMMQSVNIIQLVQSYLILQILLGSISFGIWYKLKS